MYVRVGFPTHSQLTLHIQLMHGTFQEILDARGVPALEALIEQYFNVWAWKWDVGAGLDLPLQLGMRITFLGSVNSAAI